MPRKYEELAAAVRNAETACTALSDLLEQMRITDIPQSNIKVDRLNIGDKIRYAKWICAMCEKLDRLKESPEP